MSAWLPYTSEASPARLRLLCFAHAGGTAAAFRPWMSRFPASIEVCPVELPGHGLHTSSAAFDRLPSLVEAAAEALTDWLDRPFALFGHSMGALISFELARLLQATGGPSPEYLFASGCRAPQHYQYVLPPYIAPDDTIARLHYIGGTPGAILAQSELMHSKLPLFQADFAACDNYIYQPGPPLDFPIAAFGGVQDPLANREHIAAWREQTQAAFLMRMFPGGHFFLETAQLSLVQLLAYELNHVVRSLVQ